MAYNEIIVEIKRRLSIEPEGILPLDFSTSRKIYHELYRTWLGDKQASLMKRFFPGWEVIELREILRSAERRILPSCSNPVLFEIFKEHGLESSEIVFLNSGLYEPPAATALVGRMMDHQDYFWLAGNDLGIIDERYQWVVNIDDSGGTTIARRRV